jgi:GH25 family lysozyme M1 (1,4-beta-N-acetylmuramidase)
MIIDLSSYNGKVDFEKVNKAAKIERVILRGTTRNGNLDTRFIENLNGAMKSLPDDCIIDAYKFSYARSYANAALECTQLLETFRGAGAINFIEHLWLDLEPFDDKRHTMQECAEIIAAYNNICEVYGMRLGIYCNYSYAKNVIPKWAATFPLWLARWTDGDMGDVTPFKPVLWQYTSKGNVDGIIGNVDLSRTVQ